LIFVDAEHGDEAVAMVEPSRLVVGAGQNDSDGYVSLGADGQAFRPVADHHAIGDSRRLSFEIDHADGVDTAVRAAHRWKTADR
jgi:hypothetical protein